MFRSFSGAAERASFGRGGPERPIVLIMCYLTRAQRLLEDFLTGKGVVKSVFSPLLNNPNNVHKAMAKRFSKFIRIWRISPRLALVYLVRRVKRQATHLIPVDDWNRNWLGEEMRPFNSLR